MIARVQRLDLGAAGAQGVGARRQRGLARAQRDRHAHEIVERPTRADRELRCAPAHLFDERSQPRPHPLAEARPVGGRRGIVANALRGQPADTERDARGPPQPRRVADHDLDTATADVDAQRGRRLQHHARAHGREHQPGFLVAVDDLDLDAGLGLDAVDEVAAVLRGADRARRLGDDLARAQRVGQLAEAPDRGNGPIRGGSGDSAVPGDVVAEAEHLLFPGDCGERAVEVHVGHEEVKRVRPEVERGDAHRTRRYPRAYPGPTIARREIMDLGFESRMLIDGRLIEAQGGRTYDNINPATEEVIGPVADASATDMERAITAARRAFDETNWSTDRAFRKACLQQLKEALDKHKEELRPQIVAEVGTPIGLTFAIQQDTCIDDMQWDIDQIDNYEWETELGNHEFFGLNSNRLVIREPIGVVGAITPWNFPFMLNLSKITPALAAGCTVVLKPAPDTPYAATWIGKLVAEETDIPPGVFNVVTASDPAEVGDILTGSPLVDMISFTGSTAVGKHIAARAQRP